EFNLDAQINPKKETDPTVPDLIVEGQLSDLKTQKTPFFTAYRYHKMENGIPVPYNPAYTVTFNHKDYKRYNKLYPDIDIYFWVKWKETSYSSSFGTSVQVANVSGVWIANFDQLKYLIEEKQYHLHEYSKRITRAGNARDSYLIDLRDLRRL
ncbi:MAG: RecQ family ATP-dependent DNA helicase, partial [Candidatus Pacebacteria bacterium]|nr:RecQ family ATP-dependent DNA helicase [Candidatus Paceibacterota bacterium]